MVKTAHLKRLIYCKTVNIVLMFSRITKTKTMESLTPQQPIAEAAVQRAELNRTTLQGVFHEYVAQRGSNTVADNYALLETLPGDHPDVEPDKPALTVCIPLAINREDPAALGRALDVLAKAQRQFGKPVDVIIWANAKYATDPEQAAAAETAALHYAALRERLAARSAQGLHIRTALQVLPEPEATMSKLRANYMDAVAVDAEVRDLGYDHPVMWVDADVTGLSRHVFEQIESGVRDFKSMLVRPYATHYSIDWAAGQPLSEADTPTRAVAISEIMRRQEKRHSGRMGYPEESGFAFAVGTYLLLGGINTSDPINESHKLRGKAHERMEKIREYQDRYGKDAAIPPELSMAPHHLMEGGYYPYLEIMENLESSSITMSARRQREVFERAGVPALQHEETRYRHGSFSDMQPHDTVETYGSDDVADQLTQEINKRDENLKRCKDAGLLTEVEYKERAARSRAARALVARYFTDAQKR
jgi:hypothetical protein